MSGVTLTVGDKQRFVATVTGSGLHTIIWRIEENKNDSTVGGTVTQEGNYTAPDKRGTFHLIAESKADSSRFDRVTIIVQSGTVGGTIE